MSALFSVSDVMLRIMMLLAIARSDVMFAHCAEGTTLPQATSLARKGKRRLA